MFIDYEKHRAAIWTRHLKEAPLIRAEVAKKKDFDEEKMEKGIKKLLAEDNNRLYSDQKFYGELGGYIDPRHYRAIPGAGSPRSGLGVLDQIENQLLLKALKKLKPRDHDLVILHGVERLPLKEIADLWDEPYAKIQRAYHRAIQFLRNYLQKSV